MLKRLLSKVVPASWSRRAHLFSALLALGWLATPVQAGQVTYYHTDGLGSVVMESNEAGQVTYSREYRPYGEQVLGTPKDGPGFTGHVADVDTGLTYMQQRYYDPTLGRFLSVDPVAAREKGDNFNRYAYAFNNPYKFTDPDGREAGGGYATGQYTMAGESVSGPDAAENAITIAGAAFGGGAIALGARGLLRVVASALVRNATEKAAPKLTDAQAKNLARFEKKLPSANTGVAVSKGKEGVTFKAEVPGKVPGSRAVYEKGVDGAGKTTSYTKTTIDPKGEVVHVKDKFNK